MTKCQICHIEHANWAFQPFGPDNESHIHMMLLGSHYRGFPVIKVCDECQERLSDGGAMEFTHKKQRYFTEFGKVYPVPDYVEDALLWFEETGGE